MTTQLIPVFNGTIANESTLLCNARELHNFLGVGKDFSTWIRTRITEYGFIENHDFILLTKTGEQTLGRGGHNRKDYHLTLDTAKELAMVERNEQGRKIRRYFIECERKLHAKPKIRQCTTKQLTPLRQTVERLITSGMGNIYRDIWKLVHERFEIETIQQLSPPQITEAVEYLNALEGEYIGKQASHTPATYNFDFPLSWWDRHERILKYNNCTDISLSTPWRFPVKMLFGFCDDAPSAISTLLFNLTQAGYDVSAARLEYLAHRHHAEIMYNQLERINEISQRSILRQRC